MASHSLVSSVKMFKHVEISRCFKYSVLLSDNFYNKKSSNNQLEPLAKLKDSNLPIIWILGGPGCGKGTQCKLITEKYNYVQISTGDLLRAEVKKGTEHGKEIQRTMLEGKLVSTAVVFKYLKDEMLRIIAENNVGVLIDGYPRSHEQALTFEREIVPATVIIYIECSDAILKARLLKRGRADDNEATINKRLKIFHDATISILQTYSTKLRTINAERSIHEIFRDVEKVINELPKV